MNAFKLSYNGVIQSFPLIIYAYMYQPNIPMIYFELEKQNPREMSRVVASGSAILVLIFFFVGIFGYATFS